MELTQEAPGAEGAPGQVAGSDAPTPEELQHQLEENAETAQLLSNITSMRHQMNMGIINNIR
jgi:hypothetical protein